MRILEKRGIRFEYENIAWKPMYPFHFFAAVEVHLDALNDNPYLINLPIRGDQTNSRYGFVINRSILPHKEYTRTLKEIGWESSQPPHIMYREHLIKKDKKFKLKIQMTGELPSQIKDDPEHIDAWIKLHLQKKFHIDKKHIKFSKSNKWGYEKDKLKQLVFEVRLDVTRQYIQSISNNDKSVFIIPTGEVHATSFYPTAMGANNALSYAQFLWESYSLEDGLLNEAVFSLKMRNFDEARSRKLAVSSKKFRIEGVSGSYANIDAVKKRMNQHNIYDEKVSVVSRDELTHHDVDKPVVPDGSSCQITETIEKDIPVDERKSEASLSSTLCSSTLFQKNKTILGESTTTNYDEKDVEANSVMTKITRLKALICRRDPWSSYAFIRRLPTGISLMQGEIEKAAQRGDSDDELLIVLKAIAQSRLNIDQKIFCFFSKRSPIVAHFYEQMCSAQTWDELYDQFTLLLLIEHDRDYIKCFPKP